MSCEQSLNCVTLITDRVNQCQEQFCNVLCKSSSSNVHIIFYIFCAIVLLHTNVFPTNFKIYTRESNENLKSAIKIRTTARLSCKFKQWYTWFEEWPTGGSKILNKNWSHCVPFVLKKLRDKTYLKFSFDSPS